MQVGEAAMIQTSDLCRKEVNCDDRRPSCAGFAWEIFKTSSGLKLLDVPLSAFHTP
jgi:hypothetical protein